MSDSSTDDLGLSPRLREAVARWQQPPADSAVARARLQARLLESPRPREQSWRTSTWTLTVGALAATLLLVLYSPGGRIGDAPPADPVRVPVVLSVEASKAAHVSVAGDFNGWDSTGVALARAGNRWTVTLALPAGRYAYAFRVDERWVADETAPRAPSDFGPPVSVLVVNDRRVK